MDRFSLIFSLEFEMRQLSIVVFVSYFAKHCPSRLSLAVQYQSGRRMVMLILQTSNRFRTNDKRFELWYGPLNSRPITLICKIVLFWSKLYRKLYTHKLPQVYSRSDGRRHITMPWQKVWVCDMCATISYHHHHLCLSFSRLLFCCCCCQNENKIHKNVYVSSIRLAFCTLTRLCVLLQVV